MDDEFVEERNIEGINSIDGNEEKFLDEGNNNDATVEEPYVGMMFDDVEAIFKFYQKYARSKGFSMIKEYKGKDGNGIHKYQHFTCHRSSKPTQRGTNILKPQPSHRTGCKARICTSLQNDGCWRLNTVVNDHNHDMTLGKSRYLPQHRKVSLYVKRKLVINDLAGVRMSKSVRSIVFEDGGYENMSCLEKDCRNHIESVKKLRLGEGDTQVVSNFFVNIQEGR